MRGYVHREFTWRPTVYLQNKQNAIRYGESERCIQLYGSAAVRITIICSSSNSSILRHVRPWPSWPCLPPAQWPTHKTPMTGSPLIDVETTHHGRYHLKQDDMLLLLSADWQANVSISVHIERSWDSTLSSFLCQGADVYALFISNSLLAGLLESLERIFMSFLPWKGYTLMVSYL